VSGEACYCGGCRQCLHDQGADCGDIACPRCAEWRQEQAEDEREAQHYAEPLGAMEE
jgi:hypothetical protein